MDDVGGISMAGRRLPWALVGAAWVSFAALYVTGGGFVGLPVLGVMLLGSQLLLWRLPRGRLLQYALLAIVYTLILVIVGLPQEEFAGWYMRPEYTNLIGYFAAAEVVHRAWLYRGDGKSPRLGSILLLTAIVLTAASNTYIGTHMQLLTPAYVLMVLLTLRRIQPWQQPTDIDTTTPGGEGESAGARGGVPGGRRPGLVAMRSVAIVLALAIGFTAIQSISRYEYLVTRWAVDMLRLRRGDRSQIGMTVSPRLSAVYNPRASLQRVLKITGTRSPQHIRVLAFDQYQNRQWRPTLYDRDFSPFDTRPYPAPAGASPMTFTRMGETFELLPMPLNASAIETADPIRRDPFGALNNVDIGTNLTYRVWPGRGETHQGPAAVALDDVYRQRALALPQDLDPRVIELARQAVGDREGIAKVFALMQYLRSNHNYSLEYRPGDGEPISQFLLNRDAAHCQYFASALVMMCRAVGVPARYVNGFYAHEVEEDTLIVRQRDAHAWAECWIDGVGWITADATPSSGLPGQVRDGPGMLRRMWERVQDALSAVRAWLSEMDATRLAMLVVGAAAVALLVAVVRILRRPGRRRRRRDEGYVIPDAALAELARRFERKLGQAGAPCPVNRTWLEHVDALAPAAELDRSACREFCRVYNAARFGGAARDSVAELEKLLERL